jgi:AraC-like DNA-binding protein
MQSPVFEQAPALVGQSLRVLVWDRDLVDMWCLDADGKRVPFRGRGSTWHVHPDCELTVLTHGDGVLAVGDHIGRFQSPDCIVLGAEVPHVWTADSAMAGISLQFRLDAGGGLQGVPECTNLGALWQRAQFGLRCQGLTAITVHRQLARLEGRAALQRLAIFMEVLALLGERHLEDAQPLSRSIATHGVVERHGAAMAAVVDHILREYRDEIRLDTVVAMSDMSQATFCRHFQALTGKTFVAYLNAVRIQDVRRALLETSRSVTDIAFAAGFNNLSHFHVIFRRLVGCTPRAFRAQGGVLTNEPAH